MNQTDSPADDGSIDQWLTKMSAAVAGVAIAARAATLQIEIGPTLS